MKIMLVLFTLVALGLAVQSTAPQHKAAPVKPDISSAEFKGADGWSKYETAKDQYTEDLITGQ